MVCTTTPVLKCLSGPGALIVSWYPVPLLMYGRTLVRTTQVWCPSTHLVKTVFLVFHSVFWRLSCFLKEEKNGVGLGKEWWGKVLSPHVWYVWWNHHTTVHTRSCVESLVMTISGHLWRSFIRCSKLGSYIGWEKTTYEPTVISTYLQPMNLLYVHRFLSSLT